jgi:hypothetical protein
MPEKDDRVEHTSDADDQIGGTGDPKWEPTEKEKQKSAEQLPLYDVLGWASGEVGATGLGGAVMLVFKHDDSSLWVESSNPTIEVPQDNVRRRATSNFAWHYANLARKGALFEIAAEAERVIQLDTDARWQSANLTVDDAATPFETLFVEEEWWVAIRTMPEVELIVSSFGVPFHDVVLSRRPWRPGCVRGHLVPPTAGSQTRNLISQLTRRPSPRSTAPADR